MPLKAKSTWTDVPWYFCDKESYLSWLTFIIFPQAFKNLFEALVLLKC